MTTTHGDKKFTGYIPDLYDSHFVPLLFAPYAADIARRVAAANATSVLETAAGTGVVTRALDAALPADASITSTDLNQPMIDKAASVTRSPRAITFRQADAMQLPFADASFDCVVCQFGAMFFPHKSAAFAEVRRVLRPGGWFIFNTWDRIEESALAVIVMEAMGKVFRDNPAAFFARTPHGYHDPGTIASDLAAARFGTTPEIVPLTLRSRAPSARHAAIGFCQGSPMRNEIEQRDPAGLERATDAAEAAIAQRFGNGAVDAPMRAYVITIRK
jgi:SAM-dependent methyltransferase